MLIRPEVKWCPIINSACFDNDCKLYNRGACSINSIGGIEDELEQIRYVLDDIKDTFYGVHGALITLANTLSGGDDDE
jgi:hypothetical protein